MPFDVCCLLFVGLRFSRAVCCSVRCCALFAVSRPSLLLVGCWMVFSVCCMMFVVCCVLLVGCVLLFVCCLLFVG